jgi:hypothetical protein
MLKTGRIVLIHMIWNYEILCNKRYCENFKIFIIYFCLKWPQDFRIPTKYPLNQKNFKLIFLFFSYKAFKILSKTQKDTKKIHQIIIF